MNEMSYISEIIVAALTLCICILCVWLYSVMKKRRENARKMKQIKHDFLKAVDSHTEPQKADQSPIEFLEENEISVRDDDEDEQQFAAFDDYCDDECTCNPFSFSNVKCDYCVQKNAKITATFTQTSITPAKTQKSTSFSKMSPGTKAMLLIGSVVAVGIIIMLMKQRKRR